MKIYDCFSYWNEDLLLDLRLNILNAYVDFFVIVEGNKTWQNNFKKLKFDKNKFKKFEHKIIYIPVEDLPDGKDPYKRENYQRNAISRGLAKATDDDLVKLGILVNAEPVDALSMMVHKDFAQTVGREVCEKLKDLIPRHNFMIPVQAAIGGKIIARETIKGFKKDVLTKIHGGGARDRKRKLLDKQKKGKARGKQFGKVEIPQEAFIGVLKINKEN